MAQPIARILASKAWNPPNPSHHQIWAKRHRLEPLNQPRSKRKPRGRCWDTYWSQKRAEAAAHHCPCLEEGSCCREPSWSRSSPYFALSTNAVDPHVVLPQKHRVTMPRRARVRSPDEPPMVPPRWTCALPPSAGCDVSHPLIDGGPGLDRRYTFVLIQS
jgi:hypothetical protein